MMMSISSSVAGSVPTRVPTKMNRTVKNVGEEATTLQTGYVTWVGKAILMTSDVTGVQIKDNYAHVCHRMITGQSRKVGNTTGTSTYFAGIATFVKTK